MMAIGPGLCGREEGKVVSLQRHSSSFGDGCFGEDGLHVVNLLPKFSSRLRELRGGIFVTPIACTGSQFEVIGGSDGVLIVVDPPPPHILSLELVGGK